MARKHNIKISNKVTRAKAGRKHRRQAKEWVRQWDTTLRRKRKGVVIVG